jgi:hypothetical protein
MAFVVAIGQNEALLLVPLRVLVALGSHRLLTRLVATIALDRMHAVAWPSIETSERALREEQLRFQQGTGPALDMPLTLAEMELLRRVDALPLSIDQQLVRLGLRPTTHNPYLPESGENVDDDSLHSNDRLLTSLRSLVAHGALHVTAGRLATSPSGKEQLALPPSLFAAKLPASMRLRIARAESSFALGDYEGCASICGPTLEEFLKMAVGDLVPSLPLRKTLLHALKRKEDVDEMTAGTLAAAITAIYGVNRHLTADERQRFDEDCRKGGLDLPTLRKRFGAEPARQFAGVLDACVSHRNRWSHHRDDPLGPAERVESAYALLHLTRMVISTYCSSLYLDPTMQLVGSKEEPAEAS